MHTIGCQKLIFFNLRKSNAIDTNKNRKEIFTKAKRKFLRQKVSFKKKNTVVTTDKYIIEVSLTPSRLTSKMCQTHDYKKG